jgi:hypothetical protein
MDCVYCGSDLSAYEPIHVEETDGDERIEVGSFCNYGCLSAHIEESELVYGSACEWSPDE